MTSNQWERFSRKVIDKQIDLGGIRISTMKDGQVRIESHDTMLTFFDEEWQALVVDVQSGRFTLAAIS